MSLRGDAIPPKQSPVKRKCSSMRFACLAGDCFATRRVLREERSQRHVPMTRPNSKRDLADLLKVDVEQFLRFHFTFSVGVISGADPAVTV